MPHRSNPQLVRGYDVAALFVAGLKKRFGALNNVGYKGPKISALATSAGLRYAFKAHYSSQHRRREVTVAFQGEDSHDRISVGIWRVPYRTIERDFMDLPLLIANRAPEFDLRVLNLATYSGNFCTRLDRCLDACASALLSIGAPVVSGDDWEEGLFA